VSGQLFGPPLAGLPNLDGNRLGLNGSRGQLCGRDIQFPQVFDSIGQPLGDRLDPRDTGEIKEQLVGIGLVPLTAASEPGSEQVFDAYLLREEFPIFAGQQFLLLSHSPEELLKQGVAPGEVLRNQDCLGGAFPLHARIILGVPEQIRRE
jgi:hypothetical protein